MSVDSGTINDAAVPSRDDQKLEAAERTTAEDGRGTPTDCDFAAIIITIESLSLEADQSIIVLAVEHDRILATINLDKNSGAGQSFDDAIEIECATETLETEQFVLENEPGAASVRLDSRAPEGIPDPFKDALFWSPDLSNKKRKRPFNGSKPPTVATFDKWVEYEKSKEKKKRNILREKENRIKRRKQMQEEKKRVQEEKKRAQEQKKLEREEKKRQLAKLKKLQKN